MKVCLYVRVSTDDQRLAGTIESQIEQLQKHATTRGYEVVGVYRDDGVSGKIAIGKRPQGSKLIEAASAGKFERVVVYSLDRLGRDMLGIMMEVKRLHRRGIFVESVKENLIFDDGPMGGMMLAMLSWAAEFERDHIRERTMRGRAKGREDGKIVNPNARLYGYELIRRDRQNGQETAYRINEAEAAVVREVFEKFTTTHPTVRGLADYLTNETGHHPPMGQKREGEPVVHKRWGKSTVRKILGNPAYIGHFYQGRWQTELLPPEDLDDLDDVGKRRVTLKKNRHEWGRYVEIPAIIDQKTWEKAERLLESNASRSARNRKHNYMLGGKVMCADCRSKMHGVMSRGQPYYRCYRRDKASLKPGEERCSAKDANADKVEADAYHIVVKYTQSPDIFVSNKQTARKQRTDFQRRLGQVTKKLTATEKRQGRNLEMLEDSDDTERPFLKERQEELRGVAQGLQRQRQLLEGQLADMEGIDARIIQMRKAQPKGAKAETPELVEQFLGEYVDAVIVAGGRVTDVWGALLLDPDKREKLDTAKKALVAERGGLVGIAGSVVQLCDEDLTSLQAIRWLMEQEGETSGVTVSPQSR